MARMLHARLSCKAEILLIKNYEQIAKWENGETNSVRNKLVSALNDTNVIIAQHVNKGHGFCSTDLTDSFLAYASSDTEILTFPCLYQGSLWPFFLEGNKVKHLHTLVNLASELGIDRVVEQYAKGNIDFKYEDRREKTIAHLVSNEETCNIRISDYINANINSAPLFFTQNHPTDKLLYELCSRIFSSSSILASYEKPNSYNPFMLHTPLWNHFGAYYSIEASAFSHYEFNWFQREWAVRNTHEYWVPLLRKYVSEALSDTIPLSHSQQVLPPSVMQVTQSKELTADSLPKVFFIGFNKTGTSSYYSLFKREGYNAVHRSDWHYFNRKELFESHDIYADMYERYYPEDLPYLPDSCFKINEPVFPNISLLTSYFPNAKFILNTRPLNKWLLSRLKHYRLGLRDPEAYGKFSKTIANGFQEAVTVEELLSRWISDRNLWHSALKDYISSDKVLVLDVSEDYPSKIAEYTGYKFTNMASIQANTLPDLDNDQDLVNRFLLLNVKRSDHHSLLIAESL
ncbi:hypothetical protein IQ216_03160 [Cyanobium sp. LEGE 06143]|nr:hypothetical protein [Cyanobium sp. LEGE 06143]